MALLLDWLPLIAFFVSFKLAGIYWATGVLMLGCVVQLIAHRVQTGSFKALHVAVTSVALVLGSATLLLHDKRYIQLKPTAVFWGLGIAFLASLWIGAKPLARRMLEGALDMPIAIAARGWRQLNLLWVAWFALLGAANLYIAAHFSDSTWVNWKIFGIPAALVAFMLPQVFWLLSRKQASPVADTLEEIRSRLAARFASANIDIGDDSELHKGHAGAAGGAGHYRIKLVSADFAGLSRMQRHRQIYAALQDLMPTRIHALAIDARAPNEDC
jgi:intracellular septation protein